MSDFNEELSSKQKILAAAEDLFANSGFHATSVSDIAKQAGVNKALIYYYFENKQHILDSLFSSLVEDVRKALASSLYDDHAAKNIHSLYQSAIGRGLMEVIVAFMLKKRKIIKILVAESLKTSDLKQSYLFRISDMLILQENQRLIEWCNERGIEYCMDQQLMLVSEFYTGFMPMINFAIYYDDWIEHYDISEEDFRDKFFEAFSKTHIAYHLSHIEPKKD